VLEFSGEVKAEGEPCDRMRAHLNRKRPEDRKRWLAALLSKHVPRLELAGYRFDRLDREFSKPVAVQFSGRSSRFGLVSGGRLFLNPNILSRQSPDRIPRETERKFPVYRPYASTQVDSLSISIPSGYLLESSPPALELDTPFSYYRVRHDYTGGRLTHCRTLRWETTHIPLSSFADYLAFLEAVVKSDNAKFVFLADSR